MLVRGLALTFAIFLFHSWFTESARADVPRVVASIKPVHSLVASVMKGVGEPQLLVSGASSPHSYTLRPSEVRALSEADVVFWIGPDFEVFLRRPMGSLAQNALNVALMNQPPVAVLSGRQSHLSSEDESAPETNGAHSHARDGHIWLDPVNAIAMVDVISRNLQRLDPGNAVLYLANAQETITTIEKLDDAISDQLAPVRAAPFIVFHDALQYFEKRYGLNAAGFLVETPEQIPSVKQISTLIAHVEQERPVCIYAEASSDPGLVEMVIEQTNLRSGVLDPEGAAQPPGPDFYLNLMQKLASDFSSCLLETARNDQ